MKFVRVAAPCPHQWMNELCNWGVLNGCQECRGNITCCGWFNPRCCLCSQKVKQIGLYIKCCCIFVFIYDCLTIVEKELFIDLWFLTWNFVCTWITFIVNICTWSVVSGFVLPLFFLVDRLIVCVLFHNVPLYSFKSVKMVVTCGLVVRKGVHICGSHLHHQNWLWKRWRVEMQ